VFRPLVWPSSGRCITQDEYNYRDVAEVREPMHGCKILSFNNTRFKIKKKKVKWSRYRPGVAQRVGRGLALLFLDRSTRRGWVVSSTPRPHFIPGKTRYPFYRRLGGPQGRSGRAGNLVPTGIRSRIVLPVAQSLYRLSYRAYTRFKIHIKMYSTDNNCD